MKIWSHVTKYLYLWVGSDSCHLGALSQHNYGTDRHQLAHLRELLDSGSTSQFPCCGVHFDHKAWARGHGPSFSTSLAFAHISPLAQLSAQRPGSLPAHAWYVQHLPGVPERLCWLLWRPALSVGDGLMERMVARSWLLHPVLPKAHEPLRNRKWHMTKLGSVPSASSTSRVPACPILLGNGRRGCCWTSCIHSSQQPSHSMAVCGGVWRAAMEKGQACRRKETCPRLLSFLHCLTTR